MRILLVQTSFLGDTILSTPVISNIHALFPGCELWTLTTRQASELLARDPLVHGSLCFEKRGSFFGVGGFWSMLRKLRALKFDRAFVLHRSWRTAFLMQCTGIPERIGFKESAFPWVYHRRVARLTAGETGVHDVLRNLAILSPYRPVHECDQNLRLFAPGIEDLSPEIQAAVRDRVYTVLVPGSVWNTKRWHWERYRALSEELLGRGESVLVVGAPQEREIAERVCHGTSARNLCGKTLLSELVYCIAHARAVVCNDSMALHVASAFKVPTVAVFCATSPEFGFGPWQNPRATVVERTDLACKPCSRHGTHTCPIRTEACMRDLSEVQVMQALDRCLAP